MNRNETSRRGGDWDALYGVAEAQAGYVTAAQAREAGYYPELLHRYVANGTLARVRRGVYRLVHFPASEHEELVVVWLWADRAGVFSHETALWLHGLSDVLPARVHLTVPSSWRRRRLRVPHGVVMHHAEVAEGDRSWMGPVPVTSVTRTLRDSVAAHVSPELNEAALAEARARGLMGAAEAAEVDEALRAAGEIGS